MTIKFKFLLLILFPLFVVGSLLLFHTEPPQNQPDQPTKQVENSDCRKSQEIDKQTQ